MAFQPIFPPSSTKPRSPRMHWANKFDRDIQILSFFKLSTWLLIGGLLQCILFLILPHRYAILPPVLLLVVRACDTALITYGWKRNPYLRGAVMRKSSALVPDSNGNMPAEKDGSHGEIAVLLLGTRSNHPLGLFAPGFKELGNHFSAMTKVLEDGSADNGFLGQSQFVHPTASGAIEIVCISYWRNIDSIHRFAHGPTHREAWKWWDRAVKDLNHIGINHEIYAADAGAWESIYVNFQPTMLGATTYLKRGNGTDAKLEAGVVSDEWIRPLVDANRGKLRTSAGRLGWNAHGADNDKYSSNPYET